MYFHFMQTNKAWKCHTSEDTLVRNFRSYFESQNATEDEVTATSLPITAIKTKIALVDSSCNSADKMSFLTTPKAPVGKVPAYISLTIMESEISTLIKTDSGIIDFWIWKKDMFPHLNGVAPRILVSPDSSSQSEHDVSMLKLMVTPERNRIKEDIVDAIAQVES